MARTTRALVLLAITIAVAAPARGAGLLTPEAGIVGLGRAGAFTARADDLMAVHYNPAGLWQLDGFQLGGGLLLFEKRTPFTRAGGEGRWKLDEEGNAVTTDGTYEEVHNLDVFRPIPEVAFSYGFERPDITIALGLYAPLAPWLTYPMYGPQRYRMTRMRVIQGNFFLGAGWRIADWIAIGGSFQVLAIQMQLDFWATTDIENTTSNPEDPQWDSFTHFDAIEWKPYWNAGLMIMPSEAVRVGVSFYPPYTFRGKGSVELSGDVGGDYLTALDESMGEFSPFLDTSPMNLYGLDEDLTVTTNLPAILKAGVAVAPVAWLDLELDAQVEFWQVADGVHATGIDVPLQSCEDGECQSFIDEFESRFDSSLIDDPCSELSYLVDCSTLGTYKGATGDGTYDIPEDWKNTISIRFGGEVQPVPDRLGIRFGYAFESSAVPDETFNLMAIDTDKHLLATGISARFQGFQLHFTYAHIFYAPRTVSEEVSTGVQTGLEGTPVNGIDAGTYGAASNMLGLNLVWDFTGIHRAARARRAAAEGSGAPVAAM